MNQRKMAFFEVGNGDFFTEGQGAFEKAQAAAKEFGMPAEVTMKIKVYPPQDDSGALGQCETVVKLSMPTRKAKKYFTRLQDGMIVQDGESITEALQCGFHETLGLDTPSLIKQRMEKGQVAYGN